MCVCVCVCVSVCLSVCVCVCVCVCLREKEEQRQRTENGHELRSQNLLLLDAAVVFQRHDHWEWRTDKSCLVSRVGSEVRGEFVFFISLMYTHTHTHTHTHTCTHTQHTVIYQIA